MSPEAAYIHSVHYCLSWLSSGTSSIRIGWSSSRCIQPRYQPSGSSVWSHRFHHLPRQHHSFPVLCALSMKPGFPDTKKTRNRHPIWRYLTASSPLPIAASRSAWSPTRQTWIGFFATAPAWSSNALLSSPQWSAVSMNWSSGCSLRLASQVLKVRGPQTLLCIHLYRTCYI